MNNPISQRWTSGLARAELLFREVEYADSRSDRVPGPPFAFKESLDELGRLIFDFVASLQEEAVIQSSRSGFRARRRARKDNLFSQQALAKLVGACFAGCKTYGLD